MSNMTNILNLSKSQYDTLISQGYIVIEGETYNYDANTMYIVDEEEIYSNHNILINPDFKINQRGESSYFVYANDGPFAYTFDRWCIFGSGAIAPWNDENGNQVGVEFYAFEDTTTTQLECSLRQYIENPDLYRGKRVTLSYSGYRKDWGEQYEDPWVAEIEMYYTDNNDDEDNIGRSYIYIPKTLSQTPEIDSVTFDIPDVSMRKLYIVVTAKEGVHIYLNWIKLEFGSDATMFIKPDPTLELLKCQRYFQNLGALMTTGSYVYNSSSSANYYLITIPLKISMRTTPSLYYVDSEPTWLAYLMTARKKTTGTAAAAQYGIKMSYTNQLASTALSPVSFFGTNCSVSYLYEQDNTILTIKNDRPRATTTSGSGTSQYRYFDLSLSPATYFLTNISLDAEIYM